jgi:hypothetical protein
LHFEDAYRAEAMLALDQHLARRGNLLEADATFFADNRLNFLKNWFRRRGHSFTSPFLTLAFVFGPMLDLAVSTTIARSLALATGRVAGLAAIAALNIAPLFLQLFPTFHLNIHVGRKHRASAAFQK